MVTNALANIYRALFQGDTTEQVYTFQQRAASSFTTEGKASFVAYLTELNGGIDPELTDEQLRAFSYLMKADQNSNAAKPWDDGQVEIW